MNHREKLEAALSEALDAWGEDEAAFDQLNLDCGNAGYYVDGSYERITELRKLLPAAILFDDPEDPNDIVRWLTDGGP